MDSPTLQSFNFEQFWLEQSKEQAKVAPVDNDFKFLFEEPLLLDENFVYEEPTPLVDMSTRPGSSVRSDSVCFRANFNINNTLLADLLSPALEEFNIDDLINAATTLPVLPVFEPVQEPVEFPLQVPVHAPILESPVSSVMTIKAEEPEVSRKTRSSRRNIKVEQETIKPAAKTTRKAAKKVVLEKAPKKLTKKQEREENYKATKNLTKNYGTAICNFAASDLAKPYLEEILASEGLYYTTYINYIVYAKKKATSIEAFRSLILVEDQDTMELQACKRSLQAIAIVFMKFFSVNWIIHGRINNKLTYLKWRGRILRRIENPKIFTYLKFQDKREN